MNSTDWRKNRDGTGSTENLEKAYQEQQRLLEESQTETEELKAKLNLLRIKVQGLERSNMEGSEKDSPKTTQPSIPLVFRSSVHFFQSKEATPQNSAKIKPSPGDSQSITLPSFSVEEGRVALPAETTSDSPLSSMLMATATSKAVFTHASLSRDKLNPYLTRVKFVRVNACLGPDPIFSRHLFSPGSNEGSGPEVFFIPC